MEITEVIYAYGHENIQATHKSTFEITKETLLSKKGDCIIAVSADKALADLNPKFKQHLRNDNAKLTIKIETKNFVDTINALGSSKLILTHPTSLVVRKSNYICERTLAIHASKVACDISRELVEMLKNSKEKVKITLSISV